MVLAGTKQVIVMDYLEMTGALIGLIYLWLEYKASIYLWLASIVMPAVYLVVYYRAGLYADFGINVYFLLASVYGWLAWKLGGRKAVAADGPEPSGLSHFSLSLLPRVMAVFLLLFVGIGWVLLRFTDSTVPWSDSFTTAASVIAMWMLARKYVEQWLVWIAVDVVSSALYVYKELYFTAALYALYTLIAVWGYRNWIKMLGHEQRRNHRN